MGTENQPLTDLLGDPWTPPRDPRGRKRHKRCSQVAEKVAVLKATGMSVEQIALRIGLSEPTLRKYYFREIEGAVALAQSLLNEKLWERAMGGNVAAIRELQVRLQKGKVDSIAKPEAPVKEPVLGKKEQRSQAASKVVGLFATPAAPKLVVDNN